MNRFKFVSAAAAAAAIALLAVTTTALERANAQTFQKAPPDGAILLVSCAQGFSKNGGTPIGNSMRWECRTPAIVCPPRPGWTNVGDGGPLPPQQMRSGFRLRYVCSYTK